MAFDLKIEIFAYRWFHRIVLDTELLSCEKDIQQIYKDECLAYPECLEASTCNDLYNAIVIRGRLFKKLYLEEIQKQVNEFRHSQKDFYCYVLRTCNRVDLFGNLKFFDRVFATCAFICCLCRYCSKNKYSEIVKYGYICWTMYFDKFIDEFYKQGGWSVLKMVAVSYKLPKDLLDILNAEEMEDSTFIKIRKGIKSYSMFKKNEEIDHDQSISLSWVKFYIQYINGNSDNDFHQVTEECHYGDQNQHSEEEGILKKLKYLCDPMGLESIKTLRQNSATDSLETSMDNLNICGKNVNHHSKEKTILASELKKKSTFVNSAKKLDAMGENVLAGKNPVKVAAINSEFSSKRNSSVKIGSASKGGRRKTAYSQFKNHEQDVKTTTMEHLFRNKSISKSKKEKEERKNINLTEQLRSTEKDIDKKDFNKIRYDTRETDGRRIIKDAKKITVFTGQKPSTKTNAGKENGNKTRSDAKKEQDGWGIKKFVKKTTSLIKEMPSKRKNADDRSNKKNQDDARTENRRKRMMQNTERNSSKGIDIPIESKNTRRKNSDENWNDEDNEWKIIKSKKKSKNPIVQMYLEKKNLKKENVSKANESNQKEQNEFKEEGENILMGEMFSIGKNTLKESHEIRNKARKEDEMKVITDKLKSTILTVPIINADKENSNKPQDNIRKERKEKKKNADQMKQMASTENNAEKKTIHKIQDEQDHTKKNTEREYSNKTKDHMRKEEEKKNMILTGQMSSTENNAEKKNSYKSPDARTVRHEWRSSKEIKIPIETKNSRMENSDGNWDDEDNEWKIRKSKKKSKNPFVQIYLEKKNLKKENVSKANESNQKEQYEFKEEGENIPTEEKEELRNNVRKEQEDGDIKNFLRMLLVLGDKQGISYVRKTSQLSSED